MGAECVRDGKREKKTQNAQRPTPNEENREVKWQKIEHRTPNAPNVCEIESNKGKRPTPNAQHPMKRTAKSF
jgi:hypothetical protein